MNTDIREPVNGSFFFMDGEEETHWIELRILPHGEVEVEETFVIELSVLSGELDVDPQAGSITLKVHEHMDSQLKLLVHYLTRLYPLSLLFYPLDREVWRPKWNSPVHHRSSTRACLQ